MAGICRNPISKNHVDGFVNDLIGKYSLVGISVQYRDLCVREGGQCREEVREVNFNAFKIPSCAPMHPQFERLSVRIVILMVGWEWRVE